MQLPDTIYIIKESISTKLKKNKVFFKIFRAAFLFFSFRFFKELNYHRHFKSYSFDVLLDAKLAIESIGLTFWLDFGTLLGVYREGDFLKNDSDLDIGLYLEDYSKELDEVMIQHGFKLFRGCQIDGGEYGLELSFIKNNIKIDLFFYSRLEPELYKVHCFENFPDLGERQSIKRFRGLRVIEQTMLLKELTTIDFKGRSFLIPSNIEDYLSHHYGADFMIPKNWDYKNLEEDNINAYYLKDKIGEVFK